MSRINDALKRAKAAQQDNPPLVGNPRLRPPESEQATTRRIGLVAPFVFVLMALLGVLLIWNIRKKLADEYRQPGSIANPVAETVSAASAPTTASAPADTTPQASPPPEAAELKLQAILFSPHNPSAMINGQMVVMGTAMNGYRVAAISERTVTLVNAAETNVLKLNR